MKLAKKLLALNLALLLIFSAFSSTALAAAVTLREEQTLSFTNVNSDGYRFTPTKTGYYTFCVESISSSPSNLIPYVYRSATSTADSYKVPGTGDMVSWGVYTNSVKLTAGTAYTIRMSGRTWAKTSTLEAVYTPSEKLNTSVSFTGYVGGKNLPHLFEHTPAKSGWYTFSSNSGGTLRIFDSTGNTVSSGNPGGTGTSTYLTGGKTFLLSYSPEVSSGSLKVAAANFPKVTTTSSATPNSEGYVTFTPTATGTYTITVASKDGVDGFTVYDSTKQKLAENYGKPPEPSMSLNVALTANKTYYISTLCSGAATVTAALNGSASGNHTVTFNAAGGTLPATASKTKTVTNGGTYGALPTPTRTGYTFAGWYTGLISGTRVLSTTKVSLTANQTLYARWTKNAAAGSYTVTFNANGGTLPSTASRTKTVTSGGTYGTLPTPTRTGYTFAGWYTGLTTGTRVLSTTKVSLTKNQTLYARWTENADSGTYTVKFNANGGTVLQSYKAVIRGGRYRDLPTPTRNGYHFLGWYTSPISGTKVNASSYVTTTKDHTLYAHWTTAAMKAQTTRTGSWTVTIPPYYKLPLYTSSTAAAQASTAAIKTSAYTVKCTRMAELTNGTVRYYGLINGQYRWFQFTCEMDVD